MSKTTQHKVHAGRFKGTLSDEKVIDIRERYTYATQLNADVKAEEWRSPNQIEHDIARDEGLAPSTIHKIVLGLSYAGVGGPIDHARRAQRDEARRLRKQGYDRATIDAMLKAGRTKAHSNIITVTFTFDDGTVESRTIPATTTITIEHGVAHETPTSS